MSYTSNKAKGLSGSKHIAHSAATGSDGERRFYDSCKSKKLDIKKTSAKDDIHKHTDFIVDGKSFDVKGLKKSHNEGNILIELRNVQGKSGWCNKSGVPEWVAFDFGLFFVCVSNSDLYDLACDLCDLKDKVSSVGAAMYKGYTRKDRKDLMTVVSLSDVIKGCDHWLLPYKAFHSPMELL